MSSAVSISASEATLARLKELAEWSGVSVEEALSQAVKEQHDRKFWEAVDAGYAALRADEASWAKLQAERKAWDATLMDGLDRAERWEGEGGTTT